MKSDEIRAKLNHWSFPRGPFRSVEQIYREMKMEARCMGPKAGAELAKILVQLDEEGDPLEEDLYQFLQIYAKFYPNALEKALLQELRPTGPLTLVEILGYTGSKKAVTALRQVLDLDGADDELLISVACALGELGGAEAFDILQDLQAFEQVSKPVQDEIAIALANMARTDKTIRSIEGSIFAYPSLNGLAVVYTQDEKTLNGKSNTVSYPSPEPRLKSVSDTPSLLKQAKSG